MAQLHRLPVLGLLLLALTPLGPARAKHASPTQAFQATVVSVGDSDTLRVRQGQQRITIRLACIDAPELAQRPWGERARAYLRLRRPVGQAVTIQPQTIDRYGRTVAEVISDINSNCALVEDGQAFAYRRHLHQCDTDEYLEAEVRASHQRHGVWQVRGGITPHWDFRH